MDCPKCSGHTRVTDSREHKWRRRECKLCLHRFTTQEIIVDDYQARGAKPESERSIKRKEARAKAEAKAIRLENERQKREADRKAAIPKAEWGKHIHITTPAADSKTTEPQPVFSFRLPPGTAARLNR